MSSLQYTASPQTILIVMPGEMRIRFTRLSSKPKAARRVTGRCRPLRLMRTASASNG